MKAAVLRETGEPLVIQDVPDPIPGPEELILKVRGSGICGSDLHWSAAPGLIAPGSVMGHEFVGEVVECGNQIGDRFRVGDRLCSVPFIGCGRCGACLAGDPTVCPETRSTGLTVPGAYAEYVRVGVHESIRLPEAVADRQGAVIEPLAVGLHAVKKARLAPGARVLVIGAGPIGLTVALWARFLGAAHVVVSERTASRRKLAARYGATDAIDPGRDEVLPAFERSAGGPPDVIFECVGVKGLIQECLSLAPARSQVVVVGVCMEPDVILPFVGLAKEISLQFVIAYETADFAFSVAMIEQGRIESDAMVTHTVGFEEFSDAFEALKQPSDQCKVLLEP